MRKEKPPQAVRHNQDAPRVRAWLKGRGKPAARVDSAKLNARDDLMALAVSLHLRAPGVPMTMEDL